MRALTGATLIAAALTACGVPTDENAMFADPADVPFGLLNEPPPTTTTTELPTPSATAAVTVCLRADTEVVPVVREAPGARPDQSALAGLLNDPPTTEERAQGLRSAMFSEGLVVSVAVAGGIAHVDLDAGFQEGSGSDQLLAIAQIVCTLTAQPGVGQLSFTLASTTIEVPRGDGSLTANPVARDDYTELFVSP